MKQVEEVLGKIGIQKVQQVPTTAPSIQPRQKLTSAIDERFFEEPIPIHGQQFVGDIMKKQLNTDIKGMPINIPQSTDIDRSQFRIIDQPKQSGAIVVRKDDLANVDIKPAKEFKGIAKQMPITLEDNVKDGLIKRGYGDVLELFTNISLVNITSELMNNPEILKDTVEDTINEYIKRTGMSRGEITNYFNLVKRLVENEGDFKDGFGEIIRASFEVAVDNPRLLSYLNNVWGYTAFGISGGAFVYKAIKGLKFMRGLGDSSGFDVEERDAIKQALGMNNEQLQDILDELRQERRGPASLSDKFFGFFGGKEVVRAPALTTRVDLEQVVIRQQKTRTMQKPPKSILLGASEETLGVNPASLSDLEIELINLIDELLVDEALRIQDEEQFTRISEDFSLEEPLTPSIETIITARDTALTRIRQLLNKKSMRQIPYARILREEVAIEAVRERKIIARADAKKRKKEKRRTGRADRTALELGRIEGRLRQETFDRLAEETASELRSVEAELRRRLQMSDEETLEEVIKSIDKKVFGKGKSPEGAKTLLRRSLIEEDEETGRLIQGFKELSRTADDVFSQSTTSSGATSIQKRGKSDFVSLTRVQGRQSDVGQSNIVIRNSLRTNRDAGVAENLITQQNTQDERRRREIREQGREGTIVENEVLRLNNVDDERMRVVGEARRPRDPRNVRRIITRGAGGTQTVREIRIQRRLLEGTQQETPRGTQEDVTRITTLEEIEGAEGTEPQLGFFGGLAQTIEQLFDFPVVQDIPLEELPEPAIQRLIREGRATERVFQRRGRETQTRGQEGELTRQQPRPEIRGPPRRIIEARRRRAEFERRTTQEQRRREEVQMEDERVRNLINNNGSLLDRFRYIIMPSQGSTGLFNRDSPMTRNQIYNSLRRFNNMSHTEQQAFLRKVAFRKTTAGGPRGTRQFGDVARQSLKRKKGFTETRQGIKMSKELKNQINNAFGFDLIEK